MTPGVMGTASLSGVHIVLLVLGGLGAGHLQRGGRWRQPHLVPAAAGAGLSRAHGQHHQHRGHLARLRRERGRIPRRDLGPEGAPGPAQSGRRPGRRGGSHPAAHHLVRRFHGRRALAGAGRVPPLCRPAPPAPRPGRAVRPPPGPGPSCWSGAPSSPPSTAVTSAPAWESCCWPSWACACPTPSPAPAGCAPSCRFWSTAWPPPSFSSTAAWCGRPSSSSPGQSGRGLGRSQGRPVHLGQRAPRRRGRVGLATTVKLLV